MFVCVCVCVYVLFLLECSYFFRFKKNLVIFSSLTFILMFGENYLFFAFFDRTVWVTGSTHIVLLPKNVIWGKVCDENNNSPTHRK